MSLDFGDDDAALKTLLRLNRNNERKRLESVITGEYDNALLFSLRVKLFAELTFAISGETFKKETFVLIVNTTCAQNDFRNLGHVLIAEEVEKQSTFL